MVFNIHFGCADSPLPTPPLPTTWPHCHPACQSQSLSFVLKKCIKKSCSCCCVNPQPPCKNLIASHTLTQTHTVTHTHTLTHPHSAEILVEVRSALSQPNENQNQTKPNRTEVNQTRSHPRQKLPSIQSSHAYPYSSLSPCGAPSPLLPPSSLNVLYMSVFNVLCLYAHPSPSSPFPQAAPSPASISHYCALSASQSPSHSSLNQTPLPWHERHCCAACFRCCDCCRHCCWRWR